MKNRYEVRGDVVVLYVYGRGQYHECLIDPPVLDRIKNISTWTLCRNYVCGTSYPPRRIFRLHKLICPCPPGMVVDHINGNTLDNRAANLRATMQSINARNRLVRGVNVEKSGKRWTIRFRVDYRMSSYGRFDSKEEAESRAAEIRESLIRGEPPPRDRRYSPTSGVRYVNKDRDTWVVRPRINGKPTVVARFATKEEAIQAAKELLKKETA